MIDSTLLQKLALLARVRVAESEIPERLRDFEGILACISELDNIAIPADFVMQYTHTNIVRDDVAQNASGATVQGIVDAFPARVDTRLSVPKVL